MGSWNSVPMEIIYQVLGWISIICWSFAGYPQLLLNFRRKSVVGLSFDYVVLNFTKQSSYLIYNATLFFSPIVQKQYFDKYGHDQRGDQKVSKAATSIFVSVWFFAAACILIAIPTQSWLWLIYMFNSIQVFMTLIKCSPQAFMNFSRKSTVGFSIDPVVLDLIGGIATLVQMSVQSIDQGSWMNFFGNIGKPLLALVSIAFDLIFIYQHFVLYHTKASKNSFELDPESIEPLIKDSVITCKGKGLPQPVDP